MYTRAHNLHTQYFFWSCVPLVKFFLSLPSYLLAMAGGAPLGEEEERELSHFETRAPGAEYVCVQRSTFAIRKGGGEPRRRRRRGNRQRERGECISVFLPFSHSQKGAGERKDRNEDYVADPQYSIFLPFWRMLLGIFGGDLVGGLFYCKRRRFISHA